MGGIVSGLLTAPLAPIRILTSVAKALQQQAERELYDPATLHRQLEELDEARDSGAISGDEYERQQQQILDRLISQPGPRP
jgi:hypothetical protein